MPWRAAEDMHWQLGRNELAQRAGVQPFHAAPEATAAMPTAGVPITTSFVPASAYQPPVYSTSPQSFQPPSYPSAPGPPPPQPVYSYPPPSGHGQYPQYPHPHTHPPPPHPHHHPGGSHPPPPASGPHHPGHEPGRSPETYGEGNAPSGQYAPRSPPRDAQNRPRRSESLTGNQPPTPLPARLSPGSSSPRRRALSASRTGNGMPPIEPPPNRSPPGSASLPPLPREYQTGTPPSQGQGQQLPSVRFLTDETADSRRHPPYYHHDPVRENGGRVKTEARDEQAPRLR